MPIVLIFAILIAVLFLATRWEAHRLIKEDGGIRSKYNEVFSFFYNLPNSVIGVETKSFVTFTIKDHRCQKSVRLNYYMDQLTITCKISYFDDTPFDNGKKFKWSIGDKSDKQSELVSEISEMFANLP